MRPHTTCTPRTVCPCFARRAPARRSLARCNTHTANRTPKVSTLHLCGYGYALNQICAIAVERLFRQDLPDFWDFVLQNCVYQTNCAKFAGATGRGNARAASHLARRKDQRDGELPPVKPRASRPHLHTSPAAWLHTSPVTSHLTRSKPLPRAAPLLLQKNIFSSQKN